MKPLPTDLQILNAIYDRYYNEFAFHAAKRDQKNVVPIEVQEIARDLGVDVDIVFGRLYYHLGPKYRQSRGFLGSDDSRDSVTLFMPRDEFGFDGVHFSYLASVLAELRAEELRRQTQTRIAWFSLAVSIAAVLISFVTLIVNR